MPEKLSKKINRANFKESKSFDLLIYEVTICNLMVRPLYRLSPEYF